MKKILFLALYLILISSHVNAGLKLEKTKVEKIYFHGKVSELKKNKVSIIGPLFKLTVKSPRFKLYNSVLLKNKKFKEEYKNYLIYEKDILSFSKNKTQLTGVR
jgi:hypothetical protein